MTNEFESILVEHREDMLASANSFFGKALANKTAEEKAEFFSRLTDLYLASAAAALEVSCCNYMQMPQMDLGHEYVKKACSNAKEVIADKLHEAILQRLS